MQFPIFENNKPTFCPSNLHHRNVEQVLLSPPATIVNNNNNFAGINHPHNSFPKGPAKLRHTNTNRTKCEWCSTVQHKTHTFAKPKLVLCVIPFASFYFQFISLTVYDSCSSVICPLLNVLKVILVVDFCTNVSDKFSCKFLFCFYMLKLSNK